MNWWWVLIVVVKSLVVFICVVSVVPLLVWFERRGAGWIQNRRGPNLVPVPFLGWKTAGLMQPIADLIKFIFKEDIVPNKANRLYYILAPMILIVTSLLVYAVIPIGPTHHISEIKSVAVPPIIKGVPLTFILAPVNIGVLYIFAIAGLGVYGIVLAGWSSNSKYSLLGGLRAGAQMISYEIPMVLAVVGVILMTGSVELTAIVQSQAGMFHKWYIVPQFFGFIVFLVSIFAETNRLPFDLPEGESEVVAGYHVEYGSMKFMLFYFAEYIAVVTGSMLLVTLYLGGWQMPKIIKIMQFAERVLGGLHLPDIIVSIGITLVPVGFFAAKVTAVMILFVWVRWTLPRFRYDQLMRLGWKVMLPLALINIMVTAFIMMIK